MDHTKIYFADLNSPCRELFNGGLGIVVALLVLWKIDFCPLILDVQSSCNRQIFEINILHLKPT